MSTKWKNLLVYGAIALVSAYSTVGPLEAHQYVAAAYPGVVFLMSAWLFALNVCKED